MLPCIRTLASLAIAVASTASMKPTVIFTSSLLQKPILLTPVSVCYDDATKASNILLFDCRAHLPTMFHPAGRMTVSEFKEALRIQFGKAIAIEQVMAAFEKFDKTGDGFLDTQEFVLALVGLAFTHRFGLVCFEFLT